MSNTNIQAGSTETQQMRVLAPAGVSVLLADLTIHHESLMIVQETDNIGFNPLTNAHRLYPQWTERDGSAGFRRFPGRFDCCEVRIHTVWMSCEQGHIGLDIMHTFSRASWLF